MKSLELIWSALPGGWSGTDLLLSVHISPRLKDDAAPAGTMYTVNDFPDLLNWPAQKISYNVFLSRQSDPPGTPPRGPFPATVVTSPAASSQLYQGLFKSGGFVQPRTFDSHLADQIQVRSYPVRHIHNFLRRAHTTVVTSSPTAIPSGDTVRTQLGPVAFIDPAFGAGGEFGRSPAEVQALRDARTAERTASRANSYIPPGTDGVIGHADLESDAFLQLQDFHAPRGGRDPNTGRDNPPVPIVKPVVSQAGANAIDFHRMLSLAGSHPTLQRYLGFVVDLRFTPTGVTPGATDWLVSVQPTFQSALQMTPNNISPFTRLVFDTTHFQAAPRATDNDVVNGGLAFDITDYEVLQIDHDSAALKTLDLTRYLINLDSGGKLTDDTPLAHALASIRSGGLSVARVGAAQRLVLHALQRASSLDASAHATGGTPAVYLDAEDLTLGYAIHVFDSLTNRWHSLSKRVVTYDFVDLNVSKTVHDEATVQLAPTQSADSAHPSDLYQQETLFVWTGWSLAAQRPGKTLANHPLPAGAPPTARYDNTADQDFRLQIQTQVEPGSLPRLRFGATYKMRARAVDLAGHQLPAGSATAADPHATAPIVYRRFEPVQAPTALLRKPRAEGESVERMVIKSPILSQPSTALDQHHFSPPKIHEMMAETHGLFDNSTTIDSSTFSLIASLENGSYLTSSQGTLDPNDLAETRYFDVDHLTVPYLPDPLARGIAFVGLPGTAPGSVFKMAFNTSTATWPHYQTIRVDLSEGTSAPSVSTDGRSVSVKMPKGTVATVRYSCYVNAGDLAEMGVWNWLDPATQALHQPDAVAGQVWALTPFRTLTLVHATKSPLFAPNFIGTPTVTRQVGETFASPNGSLSFSRQSTSKLQVIANWPEPRDGGPDAPDLPSLAGAHPITTAHAFDIPADVINHTTSDQVPVAGEQHHFRDTKYRLVTYSTIGTTSFTEYFVERATVVLSGVAPVVVDTDHQGFAPGTVQVTATDGSGTIYRAGSDFVADEAHMTVARVATGAIPDGARVGVAYVEPQLTLQGNSVNVAIPSTARPAAPKVLYIVPAWQRTTTTSGKVHTVSRRGGSLRVYLDRPWWSSGDGEELGVVLDPSNGTGSVPDPQLAPYVTRWGQDPIFSSATVTANLPGLSAFPNRVVDATPALHNLAELPGGKQVYVAGHSVGFDPTRNLWYCDIDVAPGQTYFPFVRLALARYQPNSITDPAQGDLALSPVVVADFAQLTPNRSVTVAGTATPGQYQVTVVGTSYTAARDATSLGGQLSGPALFSAWVEQRSSDYLGDFGWQVVAGSRVDNIAGTVQAGGDTMWTTTLTVPNRTWPFRVVLEEYEQLSQDNPASPADAGHPNSFLVGKRMVFNEIVPVTPDVVGILSVTPSGIAFGSILVGKTSALATITVSNPGAAPFTAGPVQLGGPDAGRFTISSDNVSNATFAPGAKRTVQVSFKATAVGNFNAQIQITTANGVGGPATVNLNATGVQPFCQVTPTAFSFGSVSVGTRSAAQTVTLTNTGTADLHVVSVAINGSSSQFRLSPSITGATVHPGASLTSQLTFAPTSKGAKTAQVVLTTDSPNSPQVITLTGTGV